MSRRAETVCCFVGTALALLRPSGIAVISVIMDNTLGRDRWLDLHKRWQLAALVRAEPGSCRAPPLPGMKPRAGRWRGAHLKGSGRLIP